MIFGAKSKKNPLKCFHRESRTRGYREHVDRGIKAVEIAAIVGSVGRCSDFNRDFSTRNKTYEFYAQDRVKKIKGALERAEAVPAVELRKLDDEYYVVDGHHRIITAKGQGQLFIDAHVTEYLPPSDSPKRHLVTKRIEFEHRTALKGLSCSRAKDYDLLLLQIQNHKGMLERRSTGDLPLEKVAQDWFKDTYRPMEERIQGINFEHHFPEATPADIYCYLCNQVILLNPKRKARIVGQPDLVRELGLLKKAAVAVSAREKPRETIRRIFRPCFCAGICW